MLKWIHSIHTTFRISKTFERFISFALLIFVLGSVFLITGLQAFAADQAELLSSTASTSGYTFSIYSDAPVPYTISGSTRYYRDVYISLRQNYNITDFDPNNSYFGYLSSFYNLKIEYGSSSNTTNITLVEFIDDQENPDRFGIDPGNYSITDNYHSVTISNLRGIRFWNNDAYERAETATLYYHYRIHYVSDNMLYSFRISSSTFNTNGYYIRYCRRSDLSLVDINQYCYEMSGLLQDLYINSEAAATTRNLILYELRNITASFSTDNSGVSDNVNAAASSAAAAELAADSAISSAIPSADAQLNSIADYDYNSIATNNTTALSFWKSLGDWLLSNSNLVGIGALLIGCLFIGFVVYLLRL